MAKIRLYDGKLIDPFNPSIEDISPENIIHSLSIINRYHGNTHYPYSVAQHTIALSKHVPEHLVKAAIVHDWSEAWFNDLASPIKRECQDYKRAEARCCKFMLNSMGISDELHKELDHYDKAIYINERNELFMNVIGRGMGDRRDGLDIDPIHFKERNWRDVREELLSLYEEYFKEGYRDAA